MMMMMMMTAASSSSSSSSCTIRRTTLVKATFCLAVATTFFLMIQSVLVMQEQVSIVGLLVVVGVDGSVTNSSSIPITTATAAAKTTDVLIPSWRNRNYATHPITALESDWITKATILAAAALSDEEPREHSTIIMRQVMKEQNNQTKQPAQQQAQPLKVAVCHPTMFLDHRQSASLSLEPFFAWVSYYRLLGFDRVFLWYEPDVAQQARFHEFQALPYVTLTLHVPVQSGETYHGQGQVERECFARARRENYDWALPIDVDEFIYFQKHQSIQDFLAHYEAQNITYISLGKHHYSTKHVVDLDVVDHHHNNNKNATTSAGAAAGSWFGVEQYPFTPGPYCYGRPGSSKCPTWVGRCKVLAKPSKFDSVEIHGTNNHHSRPDGTHLDTSVAHFKEWLSLTTRRRHPARRRRRPGHAVLDSSQNVSGAGRDQQNDTNDFVYHNDTHPFLSSSSAQSGIYWLPESHPVDATGQVTMHYDGDQLQEWFRFVAQGAAVATTTTTSRNQQIIMPTRQDRER